jgi:Ca2+-binding EF-hand superfamily protein
MQREFLKLAEETGGGLPLTQFVEAFGAVIGSELSKERLVHLFMKIDANSDGSVDWDEFSTYLLLGALLSASAAALR